MSKHIRSHPQFHSDLADAGSIGHRHAGIGLMTQAVVHDGRTATMRDARQQALMTAYAAHSERFMRKPPQPPILPHAVWINPPKKESASQDRAGATISTADDLTGCPEY